MARETSLLSVKVLYFLQAGSAACFFRFSVVFFNYIGLPAHFIGILESMGPLVGFVGGLVWSGVADYLGDRKLVIVCTNICAVSAWTSLLLPFIHSHFALTFLTVFIATSCGSAYGPLADSLVLEAIKRHRLKQLTEDETATDADRTQYISSSSSGISPEESTTSVERVTLQLEDGVSGGVADKRRQLGEPLLLANGEVTPMSRYPSLSRFISRRFSWRGQQFRTAARKASYGHQRLWGAVGWGMFSLLTGLLVDHLGIPTMFALYATGQVLVILVLVTSFPSPPKKVRPLVAPQNQQTHPPEPTEPSQAAPEHPLRKRSESLSLGGAYSPFPMCEVCLAPCAHQHMPQQDEGTQTSAGSNVEEVRWQNGGFLASTGNSDNNSVWPEAVDMRGLRPMPSTCTACRDEKEATVLINGWRDRQGRAHGDGDGTGRESEPKPVTPSAASGSPRSPRSLKRLLRFEIIWLLLNLFMFGFCMSLVEQYLFLYLVQYFHAPTFLLGLSIFIMTVAELPFFYYAEDVVRLLKPQGVLTLAHVTYAVRVFIYTLIPKSNPWLVLLCEPAHGITFAAMWCTAVSYANQLAPTGLETLMQGFVGGFYRNLGQGLGCIVWGALWKTVGADVLYRSAATFVLLWSVAFNLVPYLRNKRRRHIEADRH
ncbi:unnamed protein product [Vitrella brassicaformis CCMP3155]|uniref:Major facilitator superfamily associated domain-containing protein n=2 Tax=Vitrella brassicaformis TaxID=1169539 RepID=A0A0G4GZ66_VITBC|nr:unnamed protein product [Vitrella brassicaformis CCMP3155]|eukprot:CEM36518.1 unnamed protein product [Vitrella brassicaformis CCMP3155]